MLFILLIDVVSDTIARSSPSSVVELTRYSSLLIITTLVFKMMF